MKIPKWEYYSFAARYNHYPVIELEDSNGKTISVDDSDKSAAIKLINKLGAEGWELFSVAGQVYRFKRPCGQIDIGG